MDKTQKKIFELISSDMKTIKEMEKRGASLDSYARLYKALLLLCFLILFVFILIGTGIWIDL
jgi:hypothetical protein